MHRTLLLSSRLLLLGLLACQAGSAPVGHGVTATAGSRAGAVLDTGTEAAVRGAVEGLIAADNVGNPDLVVGFYADDAVMLPPKDAPIVGRDAIRNHYLDVFGKLSLTLTARSQETLVSGDLAVDRGLVQGFLQTKSSGEQSAVRDQYLMVLRRDTAGHWKVLRLMWSPAAPAP